MIRELKNRSENKKKDELFSMFVICFCNQEADVSTPRSAGGYLQWKRFFFFNLSSKRRYPLIYYHYL